MGAEPFVPANFKPIEWSDEGTDERKLSMITSEDGCAHDRVMGGLFSTLRTTFRHSVQVSTGSKGI